LTADSRKIADYGGKLKTKSEKVKGIDGIIPFTFPFRF
jgi:hypothetical protein